MDSIKDRSLPNVISLEDIELNVNPPSLENPSEIESDTSIFKDVLTVTEPVAEPIIDTLLQLIDIDLNINLNVLTPEQKNVLKIIMNNSPSSLIDIENTINSIISDNVINVADIPKFLILIKEFHELIVDNSLKTKLTGEQLLNISVSLIKFIMPIVLKKMDVNNDNILKSLNTILDASAELLLFIPIIKNGKWGLFCI